MVSKKYRTHPASYTLISATVAIYEIMNKQQYEKLLNIEQVGWYYIPIENGKATWLEPYYNQEVTLEVAVCNWNNKTYYCAYHS